MKIVPDPGQLIKFGMKDPVSTPQKSIHTFGPAIYQVRAQDCRQSGGHKLGPIVCYLLTTLIGALPRGPDTMETADTPRHPLQKCSFQPSSDYVRVDAGRGPGHLYYVEPGHKQGFPLPRNTALLLPQLVDTTKRLYYLHLYDVIHGDLIAVFR